LPDLPVRVSQTSTQVSAVESLDGSFPILFFFPCETPVKVVPFIFDYLDEVVPALFRQRVDQIMIPGILESLGDLDRF
jgi:hypothetical protein